MFEWRHEILGAAALSAVFLGLLVIAETWKRRTGVRPETTRKFVHFFGGLACAAFPFLLHSAWTVLVLAAGLFAIIAAGRRLGVLNSLHGVSRRTGGSEYYPLAIFFLFAVFRARPWLYVSSVLVLAVADAFAALIGSRYGRIRYEVENESKSLEGSLVFAGIAFFAIELPLLFMTQLPASVCALDAALTATLVTGFEAVSLRGTDNLFVPIGVAVILVKITTKPLAEIAYQNASLAALCVLIGFACRRSRGFNVGGTIAMILFAYGAWSLGSEWWAAPILAGLLAYVAAWLWIRDRTPVKVMTAFRAVVFPLLALVADNMFGADGVLYAPFVAMLAAVLGMSLWQHVAGPGTLDPRRRWTGALAAAGVGVLACVVPPWLGPGHRAWPALLAPAAIALGVLLADEAVMRRRTPCPAEDTWPARRMLLTLAAGAAMSGVQAAGLTSPWSP